MDSPSPVHMRRQHAGFKIVFVICCIAIQHIAFIKKQRYGRHGHHQRQNFCSRRETRLNSELARINAQNEALVKALAEAATRHREPHPASQGLGCQTLSSRCAPGILKGMATDSDGGFYAAQIFPKVTNGKANGGSTCRPILRRSLLTSACS